MNEALKSLTAADRRRVQSIKTRLLRLSKKAATLRDQFRELAEEAEELASNFDPTQNGLSEALYALGASADDMSRLV